MDLKVRCSCGFYGRVTEVQNLGALLEIARLWAEHPHEERIGLDLNNFGPAPVADAIIDQFANPGLIK